MIIINLQYSDINHILLNLSCFFIEKQFKKEYPCALQITRHDRDEMVCIKLLFS